MNKEEDEAHKTKDGNLIVIFQHKEKAANSNQETQIYMNFATIKDGSNVMHESAKE